MKEESGLLVTNPVYLASQSWPYPYSLMLGFQAKVDSSNAPEEIRPDGVEIAKLRWFTREELKTEAKNILLPSKISIARSLIEHWLGEEVISATELNG
jgi:NAD+ diphosphatase